MNTPGQIGMGPQPGAMGRRSPGYPLLSDPVRLWISATVMALVFSVAGYFVKAKSLGMSFWQTLVIGILLIDGALLVDGIVRRVKRDQSA